MKKFVLSLGVLLVCCVVLCAQDFSNKGRDFWIGYGNHVRMYSVQPDQQESMSLYITSDVNTKGNVSISGIAFNQNFTITANQITVINIPRAAALVNEGKFNLGIHVTAESPVVVYSHIYAQNVSGATVCLPTATLGKEYYSVNYHQQSNEKPAYSYFLVIATEDNTLVEIIPTQNTKNGWAAGGVHNVSLRKGEIYQVLSFSDLTGSTIRSITADSTTCKRIGVFSGSGKVYIPTSENSGCMSSDNLYQQMYPTNTWGKKYITVPSSGRPLNIYRILKSDITANVYINGNIVSPSTFVNGLYYDFYGSSTNIIESDKPIMAAQYFATQKCQNGIAQPFNDPEMIFLNPVEQTISNVTLNSTSNFNIAEHYINIVIKNQGSAISSIVLDGVPIGSRFSPLSQDATYSYAQVAVSSGTHNLVSDSGFNAIAYGFGGNESYGYSAGTNLRDLYQYMSIKNEYATVNFPAVCKDAPFKFSMTFPYQPLKIECRFNGLFADTTLLAPVIDSSWVVNDKVLYSYSINKQYTVFQTGTYPIKLIVINPLATTGCSGEQEIEYNLEVFDKPKANFVINYSGCFKDTAKFMEVPDPTNTHKTVFSSWHLGDGSVMHNNNPAYVYNNPAVFTVTHFIITDIGCISDTAHKQVEVNPLPKANFNISTPILCATKEVLFEDLSSIGTGAVTQWHWDFGDNTTAVAQDTSHIYRHDGSYDVKLIAASDKGCRDTLMKPVQIHHQPVADFKSPRACATDPYARFTDASSIGDSSALSYLWNLDTLKGFYYTDKNPQCNKYPGAGEYTVSLKVISDKGCVDDTVRNIFINSIHPMVDFTINNTGNLCSRDTITITDASVVAIGDLVQTEIYWDYTNNMLDKITNDNALEGSRYRHIYANPVPIVESRNFTIRYVAYSGTTCVDEKIKIITVKESPHLQFDTMIPVCREIPSFTITQAKELHNFPGTGNFSGRGITTANGLYNPGKAGEGIDTIVYTYRTQNGCMSSITQTLTVYPTPSVNAGPNKLLLQGDSLIIAASAIGKTLSYQWFPDTYIADYRVLTPSVSPPDRITYTLQATSIDGCKSSDAVDITVLKHVKAANIFSPNGDGINDVWKVTSLSEYPGAEVEIYNRYGQMVYRMIEYATPWNGTNSNGQPLPAGTYYWIIKPKNGREAIQGSVTIIR